MLKGCIFALTFIFNFAALADEVFLKELLQGKYSITSKTCFGTANVYGSEATVDVQGNQVVVSINGAAPFQINMFEGKEAQVINGATYTREGISCGNCFSYSEVAKYEGRSPAPGKKVYISQIDYFMQWQNGRIIFTRTERINARHSKKSYCDLKPLSR